MKLKYPIILVLAVALLLTLAPSTAKAEGIKLSYELNYSGNPHPSAWNRVKVTVSNDSARDIQGTVVINAQSKSTSAVFVEAGKTAAVIFYLPPAQLNSNTSNTSAKIVLQDQRGRELAKATMPAAYWGPNLSYFAVLGSDSGNFKRLATMFNDVQVVGIGPEDMDNLLFAQNFKALIINDPGAVSLSALQQENLQRWVEMGGVLVMGGGSSWQRTSALVPGEMQPVQGTGVEAVNGLDLTDLELPVPPGETDYTAAVGAVRGEVLVSAGETPLVVHKKLGRGTVLWSALALDAAPLDNPANFDAFWNLLFSIHSLNIYVKDMNPWGMDRVFNSISQDSLATTLSPLLILLLLLIYIILIGPVNWLILRKLDRREWAWLTIPVMAILFTTGAFAVGRIGRGSERVLYQVNLVDVYSENLAGIQSYSGLFVPQRGRISVSAEASGFAPMAANAVHRTEAGLATLEFPNPPLWSVQRFYGADYLDLPGGFSLNMELLAQSGKNVQAEITNNTGQDMFDSYFQMSGYWYSVGPILAGETKAASTSPVSGVDFDKIMQRYSTAAGGGWYDLEYMLLGEPMSFIGFGDTGMFQVNGVGKTVALDIWTQILEPDDLSFPPGELNIPNGVLTPVVRSSSGLSRYGADYNFDGKGTCDLEFAMPAGADYSRGEYLLTLALWGDARGSVEIFNAAQGQWQELSSLEAMVKTPGQSYVLDPPGEYVQDNRLRVRISYEGMFGFNLKGVDITVKGGMIND